MNATLLYRIASVLLILFAVGHTIGFLKFKPPTPEALAVRDAMYDVHFQIKGKNLSYGGFYNGFGLFATAYLLFATFLAWHLGGLAVEHPQAIGVLGWVFFALQVASLGLSWIYFLLPPVVLSGLIVICVGWAAWLVTGGRIAGSLR
jgi:hypothetical protein